MTNLCKRAQDGMYLLLLICMSWTWVVFSETHSGVVEDVRALWNYFNYAQQTYYYGDGPREAALAVRNFKHAFEVDLLDGRQVRLLTIVDISDADMTESRIRVAALDEWARRGPKGDPIPEEIHSRNTRENNRQFEQIREALERLRADIRRAQLPVETATVGDLQRKLFLAQVEIPYVKVPFTVHKAFWILGWAAAVIIFYVNALVDSIGSIRVNGGNAASEVPDFVLLLPGWRARVIGFFWAFAPTGLSGVGLVGGKFRIGDTWGVLTLFLVSATGAYMLLRRAKAIRVGRP
jgi:hypothetical protein